MKGRRGAVELSLYFVISRSQWWREKRHMSENESSMGGGAGPPVGAWPASKWSPLAVAQFDVVLGEHKPTQLLQNCFDRVVSVPP